MAMKMYLKRIIAGVNLVPHAEVEAFFAKSSPKLISFFKSLFEDWNATPLVAKFDSLDLIEAYVQSPKNLVRADGEEIKVINKLYKLIDRLLKVRLVSPAEERVNFERRWTQLRRDYFDEKKLNSVEIKNLLALAEEFQQREQDSRYFIAEVELLIFSGAPSSVVTQALKKWPIDVETASYLKFEMLMLFLHKGERRNFNLFFNLSEKRILSDKVYYSQETRMRLLAKLENLKERVEAEFERRSKKPSRLIAS